MFNSILTTTSTSITLLQITLCILTALLCGVIISFCYKKSVQVTKSFSTTLVILPTIVMAVIMLVNGNLGIGVAVAGSFSLVRFRSMPGKASDIAIIFLAMATGLAIGTGYLLFAIVLAILVSLIFILINQGTMFDSSRNYRTLKITIPEDLDYANTFDDVLEAYTSKYHLNGVKTVNLGTMYLLQYEIELKDSKYEKQMIDAIRCRNGNLSISSVLKADEMTDL